jgi:hypothetical protein
MTWALTLLLLSAPVQAQQTSAAHAEIEEQAMAVLKRMAEFLSQAVAGAVVGATITAAAFSAMAVPPTPVVVSGVTYYQSGSTWYQPVYQGGQVTYVIVNPPQ